MKRKWAGEFLGTFFLVFAGTGAIVADQASGGQIGHVGIALVFGLVVMVMIHTFGDVSGAHFNPAVTLGFAVAGRFAWRDVTGYVGAQLGGALAASLLLGLLFPQSATLGSTLPAGPWVQSFILEVILTAALMLTILNVSTGAKEKGTTAGITIGGLVALEALFAGPISGASMNPARSLAPALVSGTWEQGWLYPVAAFSGALLGVLMCGVVRSGDCCKSF